MKSNKSIFDKKMVVLILTQGLIGVIIVASIYLKANPEKNNNNDYFRKVGNSLHAAGIAEGAIKSYETYLLNSNIEYSKESKMRYIVGTLYEEIGQYENALTQYYLSKELDLKSSNDSAKRIVAILEKMGKHHSAKQTLTEMTALNGKKESIKKGGVVIAKIEGRPIYLHQVNNAFDKLPSYYKKQFDGKEGKIRFTQKFVAEELLAIKAKKLNYENDSEIRKKLEEIKKQLLVQKLLEQEISSKVKVSKNDLDNYYKVNKERYMQKLSANISMIKVKSKKTASEVYKKFHNGMDFDKLVQKYSTDKQTKQFEGQVKLLVIKGTPFLSKDTLISDKILKLNKNQLTKPTLFAGHYYLFKVNKKNREQKPTFDQVKSQVENDYKGEKSSALYQELVTQVLKTEDVQILQENIK